MLIGAWRRGDGRLFARTIDPHERARVHREASRRVHVHERPIGGHGEIARTGGLRRKPRQHGHGRAVRLQPRRIEGDRAQRSRRDVDQVPAFAPLRRGKPAGHVVRIAPAAHEYFLRSSAQVAHRHLGRVEAARLGRDREEDGAAAGQDFRPDVVGFTLRVVGPRQYLRHPPCGRHALQPRRQVVGREDDRVVGGPRRAAGSVVVEAGERDRRAARDGDLLQRADVVNKADPLAVW